jgi:hypothetical protein
MYMQVMRIDVYIYIYIYIYRCIYTYIPVTSTFCLLSSFFFPSVELTISASMKSSGRCLDDDDDDDDYLRLQHGKAFHNLVYMSYVIHINPACKA